jgi:glycosidase
MSLLRPSAFVSVALVCALAACGGGTSGKHDAGTDGSPGGDGFSTPDGGAVCDTSLRSCPHTFTYTFTAGSTQPTKVEVRGTFNDWQEGVTPMTLANGVWTATAPLPWDANVEYKFWAQWSDNPDNPLWSTDANNPSVAPDGNSLLSNVECADYTCAPPKPTLQLVAPPTTTATSYTFSVKFVPGTADLDPTKTVVTVNGAPAPASSFSYDGSTRTFAVNVTSGVTSPNKYGWVFKVVDTAGVATNIFVPFWVGSDTFEWRDAFLYEVMIDRFVVGGTGNGATSGGNTDLAGQWMHGDFGGVTAKINAGYFDQLGVNALWISSPILNSTLCEEGAGANAGHCIAAYHSYFPMATGWVDGSENDPMFKNAGITTPIDPHFGTIADLQALVAAAHAHGIRVVSDFVVNHVFADAAPPNGQSPESAPLWTAHATDSAWFNVPYNASINDCGDENLWDTDISQQWNRETCWFDPYLADFNSASSAVDDLVAAHAVWLMETFNLDGFRVDAAKQINNGVALAMRAALDQAVSTQLPVYLVGEALGGDVGNVMDCVGVDKFDGSLNDPLHNSIVSTFLYGSENATSFDGDVQYDEATWTGVYGQALMGHFFGSHDVPRAISAAAGDNLGDPWNDKPPAQETNGTAFARLAMAQAFLLTYDSLPILWMGDEFGQPGAIDPDNRRMMRFGTDLSVQETAALGIAQKLGTTRLAHSALRRGNRTRLYVDTQSGNGFYAYARQDGDDIVIAAFNLDTSPATRTFQLAAGGVNLMGTVKDVLSGTTATVSTGNLTVTVPPLTAAVYVQQ